MKDNDFIKAFDLANVPSLDSRFVTPINLEEQARIHESISRAQQISEQPYANKQKMKKALEETANNTAEANVHLQKIIENQNEYIDLLKQQLTFYENQLSILKNIFASGEDGVSVEKEILHLIQEQIDSNHPLWNYVKDKGGDLAVTGITTGVPVIYSAIKQYLALRGIQLP